MSEAAPATAWMVPQKFEAPTSYQVREGFGHLISRDLLGPWDGEREVFAPRAAGPRDRYLVGMLGPRRVPSATTGDAADLTDTDIAAEGEGGEDADLPEVLSPQSAGRIWASSMGVSFEVGSHVDALQVITEWGQYATVEPHGNDDESDSGHQTGRPQKQRTGRVWTREPVSHSVGVRLDEHRQRRWLVGQEGDEYGVWLTVEVRDRRDARVVRLSLVNGQSEDVSPRDTAWLFQTRLTVTASSGRAAIFRPIGDALTNSVPGNDPEERHLQLLYRKALRHATGQNVAVHAERRSDERDAWRLTTTWLPTYDVPQVSAAAAGLKGLVTSMDRLAELAEADDTAALTSALQPLADGYAQWLVDQRAEADRGEVPEQLRDAAHAAVDRAERAAERIRVGIDLLVTEGQARQAFAFANRAMALQRRNTEAAILREHDSALTHAQALAQVDAEKGEAAASWRPFQLAFVLLNLPSLTDASHADRTDRVDLLFFPTGGGKTEAYLGLAAYSFAIRRLQVMVGSGEQARDGSDGVAVLMRYTLRLLTAQQFQRAAALVCAAEVLRQGDPALWGEKEFSIGLWVGGTVSPNWYPDAAAQVDEARQEGSRARATVLQTLVCPWCGAPLQAYRDLHTDEHRRRVIIYCPEGEGPWACPFSRTKADGRGLPIITVDEEIYRRLPSLLIATVDKLAQLPWNGYAGMLFGRVSQRCPRHGYRHPDLDGRIGCGSRHNATAVLPKAQSVPVTRLRPPDLIIQDELHLISGALGTTVGLFESAVDELTSWPVPSGRRTSPKIIASTATTKRATDQARLLYARDLAIFPPQVLDATNTFFSSHVDVTEDAPGRRYLGVCAHGWRLKSAEIRLAEIMLLAGQTLFDKYGDPADPYMTFVGYFNATRELAGMRRYLDDDVASRLRTNGRRRGMSDRLTRLNSMLEITELTSRINSGEIAAVLEQLERPFDPEIDTSARRTAIYTELSAARKEKREPHVPRPAHRAIDVVLATSMLQVGVDVSRLGLMVVTGQPKNTAEYIQATSRVGRDASRPGLVVTLYNWARPRDLAHYEDFEHYHATFYRQVEALSVTPFSRRSLDRGTAATFVSAARHVNEVYSRNDAAYDVDLHADPVESVTERLLSRAERAGGPRGRDYFAERIAALKDRWEREKGAAGRLGYERRRERGQQIVSLLRSAGEGPWDDLTVARSMRETENEVNLLLPGAGLFDPVYGAPDWTFTDAGADDDEVETGDELGEAGEQT